MDVGLVVPLSGLIAAAFALLATVALAVELGVAPGKISNKNKDAKKEKAGRKPEETKASASSSAKDAIQNSADNSSPAQPISDTVRATKSGGMEALAAQQNSSAEAIITLQRSYVDGLLGHRKKYDVAIAILNEYQATEVSEEDKGLLMATQAYLSATRTGSLTSGAFALGGGVKKQTVEIDKETDSDQAPPLSDKKTGERRKPPTRGLSRDTSKKTTTGDDSNPGTARNTRRNSRPE